VGWDATRKALGFSRAPCADSEAGLLPHLSRVNYGAIPSGIARRQEHLPVVSRLGKGKGGRLIPQKFDIFSDSSVQNALWLEAVEGFPAAKAGMEELAQETPGYYFVFCAETNESWLVLTLRTATQGDNTGARR
jgi:hypothetical protein